MPRGMNMEGSQVLIIIGMALLVIAIIGFIVYMVVYRKAKKKLEIQLDAEYGERRG